MFVEDQARDALDFCRHMAAKETVKGELLGLCTVVLVDVPGPDARFAAVRMLLEYPQVQVVSGPFAPELGPELHERIAELRGPARSGDDIDELLRGVPPEIAVSALSRYRDFPEEAAQEQKTFIQVLDDILRPGGAIVCDIELETLAFAKGQENNRYAIYGGLKAAYIACKRQAETEDGIPAQEPAQLIIVSAHHMFPCRLDLRLRDIDVNVNADDLLGKKDDSVELVRRLARRAKERFPWSLKTRPPGEPVVTHRVGAKDVPILNSALDLVFWPENNGAHQISGAAIKGERSATESSGRARVLRILTERHFERSPRALQTEEIVRELEAATDKQDPPQLIFGIKRIFNDNDRDRILPGGHGGYRFGDDARIGLVGEPAI